jgi:7-cyano-7-deazaguanine synthase
MQSEREQSPRYDSIVLLSGGPDSSTLLHNVVKNEKEKPLALHISTGLQPNNHEINSARRIAEELGVPVQILDVSHFVASTGNRTITIHSDAHALQFGTAVLLSMASAIGICHGVKKVWVALHGDDAQESVEYSPPFIEYINQGLQLINQEIQVVAPFHNFSKVQIFSLARDLEVPLHETWSCITPIDGRQCGTCGACRARRAAFREIGIVDVTNYQYE